MRGGLASAAVLLLLESVAFAELLPPQRIAVISNTGVTTSPILSPVAIQELVAELSNERLALEVIPTPELLSSRLTDTTRECGSDSTCLARAFQRAHARLGLIVQVNLEARLASLLLIDAEAETQLGKLIREVSADPQSVFDALRILLGRLFDQAGFSMAGRLVVEVIPPNATIVVKDTDGNTPLPGLGGHYKLAPGLCEVQAELPGYNAEKQAVTIIAGGEQRLSFRLDANTSIWSSAWFWVPVGVAVFGGVTAIFLANRPARCACFTHDGVSCGGCP